MLIIRTCAAVIVIGILLSSSSIAFQKKQPRQKPKTNPVFTSSPKPAPAQFGTLSIDVGIIVGFKNEVRKIPRTEFSLVTKSLHEILLLANYGTNPPSLPEGQRKSEKLLNISYIRNIYEGSNKARSPEMNNVQVELKKHIVQTIKTDFNGQAMFDNIEPGEYYILGHTDAGIRYYLWNLPIKIKGGATSLILDNDNAMRWP